MASAEGSDNATLGQDEDETAAAAVVDWDLDAPKTKACLAATQVAVLASLHLHAVAVHNKVDVAHPVFAVVFQELVVLCVLGDACYVAFLFMVADHYRLWIISVLVVATLLSVQFHQITWLVVTYLRYKLILQQSHQDAAGAPPTDTDHTSQLRRRALKAVWALFLPGVLVTCAVHPAVVFRTGLLTGRLADIPLPRQLLVMSLVGFSMNLPDVISVAIYLKLLHRLKKLKQQVGNGPEDSNHHHHHHHHEEQHPVDQDSASVDSLGMPVGPPPQHDEQAASSQDQGDNHVQGVLRALRIHVALALLDLLFPAVTLVPAAGGARHFLAVHGFELFGFCLPLLVIRSGFKKIGQMLQTYVDLICR